MERFLNQAHRMGSQELRKHGVLSHGRIRVRDQAHKSLEIVQDNLLAKHREEQHRIIAEERSRRLETLASRDPHSQE